MEELELNSFADGEEPDTEAGAGENVLGFKLI